MCAAVSGAIYWECCLLSASHLDVVGVILRFIDFSLLNRAVTVVIVSQSLYNCSLIPEGASLSPSLIP